MSISITAKMDTSQLTKLLSEYPKAARRAIRKAGSTAQRDMRSEANKRIRAKKRIPLRYIRDALTLRSKTAGGISEMEWALEFSGKPVPLTAYPHRQTKTGVSVEVNTGKRTLVAGAFVATMKSGHRGVFKRMGKARLPIKELLGSRPVDALLHEGEAAAVAERGHKSLMDTLVRLMMMEMGK